MVKWIAVLSVTLSEVEEHKELRRSLSWGRRS